MEHLALEVFDLDGQGSQYAYLEPDASITITDTSEIFDSGDIWTHNFQLNIPANAHLFGTSGELHGSHLHEQINKRRARLWVMGLPLYYGYLRLDDEVDVDEDGNVDVSFESGQKTFKDMISDTKAREVSVGDVIIGVALNRKRVSEEHIANCQYTLDGLEAFAAKDSRLGTVYASVIRSGPLTETTPYVQRWPKLVKSYGTVFRHPNITEHIDYTNTQLPYDEFHPFCNINISYQFKAFDASGTELTGRGYIKRLARGKETTDGGDNQTRYNNAPNFYLLHFIDRLFKDLKIHIDENQAMEVEDLRRVFMLNFGCHYQELENYDYDSTEHTTPAGYEEKYGQYYMPIISKSDRQSLVKGWDGAGQYTFGDTKGLEHAGKILLRNVAVTKNDETILSIGSIEGFVKSVFVETGWQLKKALRLVATPYEKVFRHIEEENDEYATYSAYLAYATGDNYPDADISEIVDAMETAFGIRLIFSNDYNHVRLVLLRNILQDRDIQELNCDVLGIEKRENCIRGFRLTYGKGQDDTNFYYKGFNDLFPRAAKTWKDTSDTHDYSQWDIDAEYDKAKQDVSAFNKTCYITPVNGNAYGVKVDEDEDVLFPSLFELAGFMDAEDGDCSGEKETINEVTVAVSPVIMNEIDNSYAVYFDGDMKAPAPDVNSDEDWEKVKTWISTYGRMTMESVPLEYYDSENEVTVTGDLDIYISEGFRIRLLDNYSVSNGGTPFDEKDAGLCFGIMRSSGADAHVTYGYDPDDNEGNDTWDVVPGDGAIDHPDTCDNYGNLFDYNGSDIVVTDASSAIRYMPVLWPNSNIDLINHNGVRRNDNTYISGAVSVGVESVNGKSVRLLLAVSLGEYGQIDLMKKDGKHISDADYVDNFRGMTPEQMYAWDADTAHGGLGVLIDVGGSIDRFHTLLDLQSVAFYSKNKVSTPIVLGDNGVGATYGRFSMKLRSEKLNPFFDPKQPESAENPRYLEITNPNLRRRGLADQFYKEYSYWVRNARIANIKTRIGIAELMSFDKTKKVHIGDITGFVKKMKYSVSNKTGLGIVEMEVWYL